MRTFSLTARVLIKVLVLFAWWSNAGAQTPLKVVTYNVHGGHGNPQYNLQLFKELLRGDEHVLCLQEIKPEFWQTVKDTFTDFHHSQIVWRQTTDELGPFETRQREGNAIVSKLPFSWQSERLVQIDPGGDLWERKAGFVGLRTSDETSAVVNLACFHNTYNFDADDFAAEQRGLQRFRDLAVTEFGLESLASATPFVLAGDFNLYAGKVRELLAQAPFHFGVGRDHLVSNLALVDAYRLDTIRRDLSDHDAVVAELDFIVGEPEPGEAPEVPAAKPPAAGSVDAIFLLVLLIWGGSRRRAAKLSANDKRVCGVQRWRQRRSRGCLPAGWASRFFTSMAC